MTAALLTKGRTAGARRAGRRPSRFPLGAAGLLALGILWESLTRLGLASTAIPPLSATLVDLFTLVRLTSFWQALGLTLGSAALGFLLAAVLAIPLGVLLASKWWAARAAGVLVESFRPVPPIVILPLALLLLGGGLSFKLALILQGVFWVLLIQTIYGVRGVDPVLLDTADTFRIRGWRRLLLVRVPAAAPVIASSILLAATSAFGVSIVSELIGGERGLGQLLAVAQSGNNVVRVYAVTIAIGLVGLVVAAACRWLEHEILAWHGGGTKP
ncbi:MAG TPA: ABC transporter permease subunit [Arachnia sp.]|nr:ABC transporter permease subunit [Arachnia sp.]HMT87058.1 ABC transporter permease subunit [Arachnia sp.]